MFSWALFWLLGESALAWVGVAPAATVHILGKEGFFSFMDFVWVNLSLPLGALLLCLFGAYVWRLDNAVAEISIAGADFRPLAAPWRFFVRWVCPLVIAVILVTQFL